MRNANPMPVRSVTRPRPFAIPFPVLVLLCGPLVAGGTEPEVHLVSEAPFSARLAGIDRQWNISFRTGERGAERVRVVPAAEMTTWGHWRDAEAGPQVLLTDGGLVRADVLHLDGESLVIGDASGLGRILWEESKLPRAAVRAILYQPPAGEADRDRMWDELAKNDGTSDRLLLVGGESLAGTLVAAPLDGRFLPENETPGKGVFQLLRPKGTEPLSIPAGKVVAVSFASPPAVLPDGMSVWLGTADGSLVQVARIEVQAGVVKLPLATGGALIAPLGSRDDPNGKFWDEVTLLEPNSPNAVWLSDRKTLGYKHIPFLSIAWPYADDRTATGTRLRTAAGVVRKGLGMHSTARLAYDTAGFRKFEAELALDQSVGRSGSVVYKVLLQDAAGAWLPAYESPIIRGGELPVPISIDLKGATRLALIVEFADRGDELDVANWLHARLVK
jgi:hypothetical protein